MASLLRFPARKATREEHRARMLEAEKMLFQSGWRSSAAARKLAADCQCSERQAWRYLKAVRAIYKHAADKEPGGSLEEMIVLLHSKAALCCEGAEPDWKASAKFLELAARLQGWLDRRSTVTVQGTIGLQPLPALDGASDEEIALLAQYHDARARRLAEGERQPVIVGALSAVTPTE